MANVAVSVASFAMLAILLSCKYIADAPKTAKNIKQTNAGTNNTPKINSLIVRPLETRAINIPTNGAQDTHHAQ